MSVARLCRGDGQSMLTQMFPRRAAEMERVYARRMRARKSGTNDPGAGLIQVVRWQVFHIFLSEIRF